MESMLASHPAF